MNSDNVIVFTLCGQISQLIQSIERRLYFLCLDQRIDPIEIGF